MSPAALADKQRRPSSLLPAGLSTRALISRPLGGLWRDPQVSTLPTEVSPPWPTSPTEVIKVLTYKRFLVSVFLFPTHRMPAPPHPCFPGIPFWAQGLGSPPWKSGRPLAADCGIEELMSQGGLWALPSTDPEAPRAPRPSHPVFHVLPGSRRGHPIEVVVEYG